MRFLLGLVCLLVRSSVVGSFSVPSSAVTPLGGIAHRTSSRLLPSLSAPVRGTAAHSARWSAPSGLRQSKTDALESSHRPNFGWGLRRRLGQLRQLLFQIRFRRPSLRRPLLCVVAVMMLWLGAASLHAPPALASSTTATAPPATTTTTVAGAAKATASARAPELAPLERVLERTSPSVDRIVDRYVRDHMFDDDAYDPVESLYREAHDDATTGAYPQALREVAGDAVAAGTVAQARPGPFMRGLQSVVATLAGLGLSEARATQVVGAALMTGAGMGLLYFLAFIGDMSKRRMQRMFKDRYGEDFTLDATLAEDKGVELPEDDDEDEDDDDDD